MSLDQFVCDTCGCDCFESVLHRQNELGVDGVWRCENCGGKPSDPVIADIVDAVLDREQKEFLDEAGAH